MLNAELFICFYYTNNREKNKVQLLYSYPFSWGYRYEIFWSIQRKSDSKTSWHHAKMTQVSVFKTIAIWYPNIPACQTKCSHLPWRFVPNNWVIDIGLKGLKQWKSCTHLPDDSPYVSMIEMMNYQDRSSNCKGHYSNHVTLRRNIIVRNCCGIS